MPMSSWVMSIMVIVSHKPPYNVMSRFDMIS